MHRANHPNLKKGDQVIVETGVGAERGSIVSVDHYWGNLFEYYIEFTDRFETFLSDEVALVPPKRRDEKVEKAKPAPPRH